ncbi:phage tail sheath family protein [Microbulbifer taiwanensis]|uniref:phage tail sheath family protein n=1 Tax=Microbulbifer taiwanensis TaxID=986746 RepID=UPI003611BE76
MPARGDGAEGVGESDLAELEQLDDFDLVCAPDMAALLPPEQLARAHKRILKWCAQDGLRFAILDGPRTSDQLDNYRKSLARELRGEPSGVASFGAGYYPWLNVARSRPLSASAEAAGAGQVLVPPSGHVAGIYSRSDRNNGIWAAPANDVVVGVLALDGVGSGAGDPQAASAANFNGLRSFRKRGIRVWGARTLSDDPSLVYITARRLLQAVARRLEQVLAPVVFEPNSPLLWARVNRIVSTQLDALYRSGALAGATAEDAYFVRCDGDTNSPQARAQGQVVAEAGIAAVAPAEFISIDIRIGDNQLAVSQQVGG